VIAAHRLRRLTAAVATLGLLASVGLGAPGPASAEQGDVKQLGGQGPDDVCKNNAQGADDGTAPLAAAKFNFSSFGNARSIAVDAGGQNIFVPDRGLVRGISGLVAGVAIRPLTIPPTTLPEAEQPLKGAAAEGADPKQVELKAVGVAVDALGEFLYIVELKSVRQVNLKGTPAIHTIARDPNGADIAGPLSAITADKSGNVFVASRGTISRVDKATKTLKALATVSGSPSLTIDAGGTALYAADALTVQRINPITGEKTTIAGGGTVDSDGVAATSVSLTTPLAVAVDPTGAHLYISDGGRSRIRKVDLVTGIINTVVGSGTRGFQPTGKAPSLELDNPVALAVDFFGNVYILAANQCAVLFVESPVVIFTPPPSSTPVSVPPPTTVPPGTTGGESRDPVPDPAVVINNQGSGPVNQAAPTNEVVPQTEMRIIDQGSAVPGPEQVVQPTPQPVQTPSPAAQFTATPAPTPAPTPTPTPAADVSTAVAPEPGPSGAVGAEAAPVAPPAPGPAPGSALPPAATEPVANVGLAHGDSEASTRGATRYAMVRNDEDAALASVAMAAGAGLLAIFLCVMFVAPGASSKPKPRPKGAY
jgi:sugar lactone lactonase YvrE